MKSSRLRLLLILFLVIGSIFVVLPPLNLNLTFKTPQIKIFGKQIPAQDINAANILGRFPTKLGLDLQGGTQLVLQTKMEKIAQEQRDNALESAKQVIERRVNLFGVAEAVVQTSKLGENRRILVDLPGVKDSSAAAELVGKTAQLEFRELPASPSGEATNSAIAAIFQATPTGLTGADLKKAEVTFASTTGTDTGPKVSIEFTSEGAKKFAEITRRNVKKPLAIFLDEYFIDAPVVQQEILDGVAIISGSFTAETAKNLAVQLNAGALPVPIEIIEQRSIGATLGQESVNKSLIAGVVGIITVMLYMALYYGFWGIIADIALVIYTLLIMAIFNTGLFIIPPVTLTLAGIAGVILSIGMAVDANILIFERMKEEKRWGRSSQKALELGFSRAWSSIWDSNISSLITSAILYSMGTGLVRGFAVTLAIGVMVSMFTAVTVTRTLLKLFIK